MHNSEVAQHIAGSIDSLRATKLVPNGRGGTQTVNERDDFVTSLQKALALAEQVPALQDRIAALEASKQ